MTVPLRTSLPEEQLRRLERRRVEQLRLAQRFGERRLDDLRAAQADHRAPALADRRVHRGDAEARREHAVERDWAAASLHVAEYRHATLVAGDPFELALERDADAAEPRVAERVGAGRLARVQRALARDCALGDDDDREVRPARVALAQVLGDVFDIERALGDEEQ